jgi:hypothetical protein
MIRGSEPLCVGCGKAVGDDYNPARCYLTVFSLSDHLTLCGYGILYSFQ